MGASIHVSLDGVNEYVIEVDEQGEIVMPEVDSVVYADASDCALAISQAVASSALLALELFPALTAVKGIVSTYRAIRYTASGLNRLSRSLPVSPRKAGALLSGVVLTAGLVDSSFDAVVQEC